MAVGANPMALKRGLDKAVTRATREIKKTAKPVTEDMIAHVGAISANDDVTIGKLITKAMQKVGKNGVITVEESKTIETGAGAARQNELRPFPRGRPTASNLVAGFIDTPAL